jgi:hypothetical protein
MPFYVTNEQGGLLCDGRRFKTLNEALAAAERAAHEGVDQPGSCSNCVAVVMEEGPAGTRVRAEVDVANLEWLYLRDEDGR